MKKTNLSEYIIQICIVIIGVFLGMLVTEWNSQRTIEDNKYRALLSIKAEIESNLANLKRLDEKRISFYRALDSLSKIVQPNDRKELFNRKSFQERLPNWTGLGVMSLNSSMFEAAKYGNVLSSIDLNILQQLSQVYQSQGSRDELMKVFLNKFTDINDKTTYDEVLNLVWRIREELWGSEYYLIQNYEKTLQLL